MQHVCLFEDFEYSQLCPQVYTKTVFELRCGLFTPIERTVKFYENAVITLFSRNYLTDILRERYPYHVNEIPTTCNTCLFLNGRVLLSSRIPLEGPEEIGIRGDTLVYARLKRGKAQKVSPETFLSKEAYEQLNISIREIKTETNIITYFWDIIKHNKSQLKHDFSLFIKGGERSGMRYDGVYLINERQIFIGNNSRIKPCCVIDAEAGPVYIGDHVVISPNTTIEGPAYIGNHSIVQAHSTLREGSNVGEVCKVGGEIVNTIFHSFSNKQHNGFLGDSYVGSWVNIGAGTINSNLLNTYGSIKVQFKENTVPTNQMFLGMSMGDHTKTAINTRIMTGSIIGFGCNIITNNYPPKFLPSFTWCSDHGLKTNSLEKVIHVAKITMKRRDRDLNVPEEQLIRKVFQLTEAERNFVYAKEY